METIKRSWRLFKTSYRVASKDKELIYLQLIATVITVVGGFIIWGLMLLIFWDFSADAFRSQGAFYAITSLFTYWLFGAVFSYYRGAQTLGVYERITGGDPTVKSALVAVKPFRANLIKWGMLTATVSFILAAIRAIANSGGGEKGGAIIVEIMTRIIGAVWDIITFLALPVIVFEKLKPIEAVKRSAKLLKETWGLQLVSGLASWLLVLIGGAVLAIPVAIAFLLGVGSLGFFVFMAITVVALFVGILYWTLITVAYQTAIYIYATTGQEPELFAGTELDKIFHPRKSKNK